MSYPLGDCCQESAQALWATIPVAYCEPARFHAGPYDAYTGVHLVERHKAITKQAQKTHHIKHFNTT